jgi:hypothetical protein
VNCAGKGNCEAAKDSKDSTESKDNSQLGKNEKGALSANDYRSSFLSSSEGRCYAAAQAAAFF